MGYKKKSKQKLSQIKSKNAKKSQNSSSEKKTSPIKDKKNFL